MNPGDYQLPRPYHLAAAGTSQNAVSRPAVLRFGQRLWRNGAHYLRTSKGHPSSLKNGFPRPGRRAGWRRHGTAPALSSAGTRRGLMVLSLLPLPRPRLAFRLRLRGGSKLESTQAVLLEESLSHCKHVSGDPVSSILTPVFR